ERYNALSLIVVLSDSHSDNTAHRRYPSPTFSRSENKRMIGVGKIKQYGNVLDKPLNKGKTEVSLSAFAFLFSELVQYNQTQVDNIGELERRS
ncbi:hypothetical protein TSUD_151210, partial [Trifolium subterraneum]